MGIGEPCGSLAAVQFHHGKVVLVSEGAASLVVVLGRSEMESAAVDVEVDWQALGRRKVLSVGKEDA